VAVIGDRVWVQGWALAGAQVWEAGDATSVRRAWHLLGEDVSVVLLTQAAADCLATELSELTWPLVVVIPP
jgi:vacuolar-type H+-ATPase subunit F/Vma7